MLHLLMATKSSKRRSHRRSRKRHGVPRHLGAAPGSPPGVVGSTISATQSQISVIRYGIDHFVEQSIETLDQLDSVFEGTAVAWVDVIGVADVALIEAIGARFGLHTLALEDVVRVHQRPKVEVYDGTYFIVLRIPHQRDSLELEQVSLFLGTNFVITVQEYPGDCLDEVRRRIRDGRPRIRSRGADYLAYAIIDAIVDSYFPVLETYGDRLDALERRIFHSVDAEIISEIHASRQELTTLRRYLWPLRDVAARLTREDESPLTRETILYMRDCQDHAFQLLDIVDSYRDLSSSLRDAFTTAVSTRLNEVMKVLTLIATIFIPLSFIAGLYGMNFERSASRWNMPELGWSLGYPFALSLMVLTAGGMLLFFRTKGWLGGKRDPDD